ncbi:MAG: hypothetical protein LBE59_02155 [Nevskiaceae bacterium]|jgi:hypothetical protein|nr:hypothetical protein [Nevskiaceae bacterium]
MGSKSRSKGKSGEREIASIVRDLTGWDVRRRVRQHEGDSDLDGVPGWSVEVKRHASAGRADLCQWWRQAEAQARAAGLLPVLFYRRDRDEWRAVWPVSTMLSPSAAWSGYEWTVEGSIEAWAALAANLVASQESERPPW